MDKERIVELQKTFDTPGWKYIIQDAAEAFEFRKEMALNASTVEELFYFKGEANQIAILLSLEASTAMLLAAGEDDGE